MLVYSATLGEGWDLDCLVVVVVAIALPLHHHAELVLAVQRDEPVIRR